MDELLKNYIKHIQVNFSSELAEGLSELLNRGLENNSPIEDIEKSLQNSLIHYFQNLQANEFGKTARSLYEAYVDYDDENLICSVRFLIRIYSKFINLKLAKFFCNWRIKAIQIGNTHKLIKLGNDDNRKTENFSINNKSKRSIKENKDFILKDNEEKEKAIYYNSDKIDRISRSKNELVNKGNNAINDYNNIHYNNYGIENKLIYNYYNDDPPGIGFDNNKNLQNFNISQSFENKDKSIIEEKYSKSNLKGDSSNNPNSIPNINNENGFRTQRNKNNEEEEEIKKMCLKPKIRNNNFAENKNISFNSNIGNSPSSIRRASNIDNSSKEKKNNSKYINNKEENQIPIKLEKERKENNSNSMTIFDKLFLESYKKSDEKLLNEEIKKLSELEECTFQPNSNKRGIL